MLNPKVLVVDDQPINVQLVKRMLEKEGMEIIIAHSGAEALESVSANHPDLILLDVVMPDMDGFEVCRRLQADDKTRHIPVIFITSRDSKGVKIAGLGMGAVDYITKPFDIDETVARIQTQLRLVKANHEMIELQRRLSEARSAATVGAVTQGVAHNLNNLLGVAMGYLDLVQTHYDDPEKVKRNSASVESALQRIITIIRQLGSLVVKSRPPLVRCSLSKVIRDSVARYQAEHRITEPVQIDNPLGDQLFETHVEILEDILARVLINAWESYEGTNSDDRSISIQTATIEKPEGKMLEITIADSGRGIQEDIRDTLFEPFVSSKHIVGAGMGLTVARYALRNLGGEIRLTDRPGGGVIATITHPLERKPKRLSEVKYVGHKSTASP